MSNVIKGNYGYSFQEDDTRVIDTNQLVAAKLEVLSQIMQTQVAADEAFSDGFTQGINALQVEQLLADPDEDGADEGMGGNVIKANASPALLEEAQTTASNILADANQQADDIIAAARAEAEQIKAAAYEEGNQAGYDEGYAAGRREGLESYENEKMQLMQERQQMQEDYERQLAEVEPRFVETITEIYEHIFHVKLSVHKDIVYYLLQDAVRKIENNRSFIIHVSKEDYGFVSMQKKELLAGIAGSEGTEIVEDMTLRPNECFIDTGSGIFDCSLETQLQGLKRELRLLSFSMPEAAEQ